MTAEKQILKAAQAIDEGYAIGLRRTDDVKIGDHLESSVQWIDGDPTDSELAGTCTVNLRSTSQLDSPVTEDDVAWAVETLDSYPGDVLVLVIGDDAGAGEDDGELLIRNAQAVAVWTV